MGGNFKLRIVFWNNFFGRFEKRISLSEKKAPLDSYERWTIQYKSVHSGAGSFTDCDASQRCFIFELCPLIHVTLNS